MPDLIRIVEGNILSRKLLRARETALVAVSGGVDSMVLLDVLSRLKELHGWRFRLVHLNHQLRGKESDADEKLVRSFAARLKVPVEIGRADIRRIAKESGVSIEMAARVERHAFLAQVAQKARIGTILLAHHADDQVELFFLRLFRGAGTEGLAGMKWRGPSAANRNIGLVRPLMNVPKSNLLAYASEHKVPYHEDATNECLDMRRNRIRHELLPLIQKHYQAAIQNVVLRATDIIAAESDYVAAAARGWLKRRTPDFAALDIGVQRRVLHLQLIEKHIAPDYDLIEKLRLHPKKAVCAGAIEGATIDPKSGHSRNHQARENDRAKGENSILLLSRDADGILQLHVERRTGFLTEANEVSLLDATTGRFRFDGMGFEWSKSQARSGQLPRFGPGCEWFDADKVGNRIVVRHWAAGDRFQPVGLKKATKLQDIFVNLKIPRHERPKLVLATTTSGEVFWVEKLRISERFKLCPETKRRLQWRWRRA